jgi:hypothetical protein
MRRTKMSTDPITHQDIVNLIDAVKRPVIQTRPLNESAVAAVRNYESLTRRLRTLFEIVPADPKPPIQR